MLRRRHWIFDLDGTLTVAVHDFSAFKAAVGLPDDQPILEAMRALSPARAAEVAAALHSWEAEHARLARPAPHAAALLSWLSVGHRRLGILTRNTAAVALITLEAAGLAGYFSPADVLGRDEAAPKPAPDGVLRLLGAWGAAPTDAVMVGDWIFDVAAGRAAGVGTVLVDATGRFPSPPPEADRVVGDLSALLREG